MYCYYKCSVALPHGDVGWSAVCDVVFPYHTHLLFQKTERQLYWNFIDNIIKVGDKDQEHLPK